jgi:hypothetical protein
LTAKPRRSFVPWLVPLVAVPTLVGCPLQKFEVDQSVASGGMVTAGGGQVSTGGAPNSGGSAGFAGQGGHTTVPRLTDDLYFVPQNTVLRVSAERGLLANDVPVHMTVNPRVMANDPERPPAFDADLKVQSDGSFTFSPAKRFFGTYRFSYEALTSDGQSAHAVAQVRVTPTDVDLGAVAEGIGGFVIRGSEGSALGSALDRADDIDRDGRRDIVVGAPEANGGDGAAFVVFGKNDAAPLNLELEPAADGPAPYVVLQAGPGEGLGASLTSLGDIDRDGRSELAISATSGAGRVYIVPGAELSGSVSLLSAASVVVESDGGDKEVGRVVRGVGDVNGDAIPDVLVSSRNLSYGWLHVLFGGPSFAGNVPVASTTGIHRQGPGVDDRFPLSAAGAGDLDGDGKAEVFVSSDSSFALLRGGSTYPTDIGDLGTDGSHGGWRATRSASGEAAVALLLDVNGDSSLDLGYCDGTASCAAIFGPPQVLLPSWNFSGFSSRSSSAGIGGGGDVDGDGISDVLLWDDSAAYVVFGKRADHHDVDVRSLGAEGFILRAPSNGHLSSAIIAGDVNGDGIADLAIGDASADDGAGRVYVVFGVSSR